MTLHPRAILFDLDGTLVHSSIDFEIMREGIRRVAADHGVDRARLARRDVLGLLEDACALAAENGERVRRAAEDVLLEEERRAAEEATVDDDARALLDDVRASGRAIGIVTRNSRHIVEPLLARLGLACDTLVAREDTPRAKPAPIHVRIALVRLRTSPRHAYLVGDHAMDALGGRRAGVRTFGVPTRGDPEHRAFEAARPDVMLARLGELRAHFGPA